MMGAIGGAIMMVLRPRMGDVEGDLAGHKRAGGTSLKTSSFVVTSALLSCPGRKARTRTRSTGS